MPRLPPPLRKLAGRAAQGRLGGEAQRRGEAFAKGYVTSSSPRRLEQTVGSGPGLRLIFAAMTSRFDPRAAEGFTGSIRYDLVYEDKSVRSWTVRIADGRAVAKPGGADERADLTLKVALSDFLRIGVGELNPLAAVLNGQLELQGDFGLAMRMGSMFGLSAPG